MKKKRSLFFFLLIAAAVFFLSKPLVLSYNTALQANWGFALPVWAVCSEVYEKDSGADFHGDGIRYHVFSYKYEDYIDTMCVWLNADRPTLHYPSQREAARDWLEQISVPEKWLPDYDRCSTWYRAQDDGSEMILFFDAEKNLLYLVESFF